jgi:hypothetical protein
MNYKDRFSHAISAGIIKVLKKAWHHAKGPGRATTYRLSVPVVLPFEWVMNYEAALKYLTRTDHPDLKPETNSRPTAIAEEQTHANHHDRTDSGRNLDSCDGTLPAPVHPPCSGAGLDFGPRQCDPEPDATPGLHRQDPPRVPAISALELSSV